MNTHFTQEAIKEGLRYQGRQINEFRKIKINLGPALGTATVQLGSTRIISHVSGEVVRPSQASSTEGSISINTEFSPMAFPGKDKEETSEMEIQFSRILERTIRNSRAVDTEGLCIVAGEKVLLHSLLASDASFYFESRFGLLELMSGYSTTMEIFLIALA
jgi:exosome complex component RRP45